MRQLGVFAEWFGRFYSKDTWVKGKKGVDQRLVSMFCSIMGMEVERDDE